jgi:hypothetical protein
MLADLVSSVLGHLFPLIRGRDARRFGVDPSINWGDIYTISLFCLPAPRRDRRSPRRVPPNMYQCFGGFSVVLRDVKLPVGPWGSKWALADLEPRWLTGISFMNWRDPSCLKLDRAAAARLDARAAYSQGSLPTGPALCTFLVRCASPLEL